MTAWDEQIERTRGEFLERFSDLGFTVRSSSRIFGEVEVLGYDLPIPVDITIPGGFPYEKPRVKPTDGSGGSSWHRDRDYSLCLWADEEAGDLPWVDPSNVVERIKQWFEKDLQGWPDDPPDLDLERYWRRIEGLVLYEEISGLGRQELILRRQGHGVLKVHPVLRGAKGARGIRAAVIDAGELGRPLRTSEDVLALSGGRRDGLEWDLSRGKIGAVLVMYSRAGLKGLLALVVVKKKPIEFSAMSTAHGGAATLRLRCGPDAGLLGERRVAVVGLGAIGSVAADLLARAGIGHMTFVDDDIIRPGNCVRHLVDHRHVGQFKVDAVRDVLITRGLLPGLAITARRERLTGPQEAASLLNGHDLVLDATANQVATALLMSGGQALGRPAVSVCLQNDGGVARVDRVPLRDGEMHAPPVDPIPSARGELREGGCGDPLSPAPMWAVTRAASDVTAVVCDLLSGRAECPPSLVVELASGVWRK